MCTVDYVTLTYRQYAMGPGLGIAIESSTDFKNSTTVAAADLSQQIGIDPTAGGLIMEIGARMNSFDGQFLRLEVTAP